MRYSNQGWFREQFGFLQRQFLQKGDLTLLGVSFQKKRSRQHWKQSMWSGRIELIRPW